MPQIKSAMKRVKTNEKARDLNAGQKAAMRTAVKKFETANTAKADDAQALYTEAIRSIDMAATKGLIHANKAARDKSRLTKLNQAD
ncbi:30S ribosomal protein S20 [Lapidilactobacillus mulanensis]|uniref:Small ribosomal subunit protein bS20 n=1 Tax=Lapidilactobacillus mulanensis TaxID=2485999 RepID=A0ABW4DQW6_9LACO|nr:30S ribosomal protein S20 [Lapidilactobacillus mulanensis]